MTTIPNIAALNAGVANTYTAASSFNITVPSITNGSLLQLAISNESSSSSSFVSSITGGGTWTQASSVVSGSTCLQLWQCPNANASVTTISVTLSTTFTGRYCYGEFSGLLAVSPLDQTATGTAVAQPWSITNTTGTVAQQVELAIEADLTCNVGKGGASTTPSGYTKLIGIGSGSSNQMNLNYKIRVKAVGTESSTLTGSSASGTVNITSILATYKAVTNVIQQTNSTFSSGTTATVAVPLAGNTGILAVNNISGGASTVTQTGNTWTKVAGPIGGTNAACDLWYSKNMSGSASTTITFGISADFAYTEVFGLSTTAPLDKSVTSTGLCATTTTNAVTGTTSTTSNNPQAAFAAIGMEINGKSGTWSLPLNGYVSLASTSGGGAAVNLLMGILTSNITTSTGATLNPTSSSNNYGTVLGTFRQGSSINNNGLLLLGIG